MTVRAGASIAGAAAAVAVVALVIVGRDGSGGSTPLEASDNGRGNMQRRALEEDFPSAHHFVDNPAIRRLLRSCPITRPNHNIPPGEEDNPGAERSAYYGNGKLWTVLYGIVHQTPKGTKFLWWRGVPGRLTISGRRLDGPAPALRARIPDGYGPIDFQATRIFFPTPGCWRATGTVGGEKLSFVTLVVRPADE